MNKKFKGKAIYNPSGKAGEYSYWACNFYVGCSNGCTYCYCKKGILAKTMGQNVPKLKSCFKDEEHALEIFEKEINKNVFHLRRHGLFFSFTTDPMISDTIELTAKATEIALGKRIPIKILTKDTNWVNDVIDSWWLKGFKDLIAFGFTLTGRDDLEPNASPNKERIEAMKKIHDAGFKTFASIEPIIDFYDARNVISMTEGFCDLYKVGLMSGKKYDVVEAQTFVEWLMELENVKIYLKESLQKLTHYTNDYDENFVDRDFNLFNLSSHV